MRHDLGVSFYFFKNSALLLIDQFLRVIFALVIGSWTARYLGHSQFGEMTYAITFITVFQMISSFSMDSIGVREFIVDDANSNVIFGSLFFIRIFLGLICWILSVFLAWFFLGLNDASFFLIFILGISLVVQSLNIVEIWFQSQKKISYITLSRLSAAILSNLFKIYLIEQHFPLVYFAITLVFDSVLFVIFLLLCYRKYPVKGKLKFHMGFAKRFLKDSFPFVLGSVAIFFYTRIDFFIIKKYLSSSDLGLYSAVITISSALPMIPMVLINVISPLLLEKKLQSQLLYNNYLIKVFKLFSYLSILLISLIFYFSNIIIEVLFGIEYIAAAPILRVHVFTNFFIYMGIVQNVWMVNANLGRLSLFKTLIGLVIAVGMNMIMIPMFGITGAAYSAVVVQFVSSFLINIFIAPDIFRMQCLSLYKNTFKI
jgi:O-antigen/teichoic acid export membrane protein